MLLPEDATVDLWLVGDRVSRTPVADAQTIATLGDAIEYTNRRLAEKE